MNINLEHISQCYFIVPPNAPRPITYGSFFITIIKSHFNEKNLFQIPQENTFREDFWRKGFCLYSQWGIIFKGVIIDVKM